MKPLLFEEAKQKVAERHRYESWNEMWQRKFPISQEYYEEVYHLGCNEAVKADRESIAETLGIQRVKLLPLPFPES